MTQIATTIEQSKDLLRLGLNPDTADMINMCYSYSFNGKEYTDCKYKLRLLEEGEEPFMPELNIPSWSLTALLKLMPKNMKGIPEKAAYHFVLKKNVYDAWRCNYEHSSFGELYSFPAQKTPLDAAYNMVAWLLENGHIKTEKK